MQRAILLLSIFFLLTACAPTPTATPTLRPTATLTLPIPTLTLAPSATPLPTQTPLPTIPTFTPTFDAQTIVTVTPAPKVGCYIKENLQIRIDFELCDRIKGECSGPPSHEDILSYLHLGGSLKILAREVQKRKLGSVMDLTGDGSIEVAYMDFMLGKFFIYGCKDVKYATLFEFEGTQGHIAQDNIVDLNKNGIPELIFSNYERRSFHSIRIFEWDGSEFRSLIEVKSINGISPSWERDWVGGTIFHYKIIDTNEDGVKEIIAIDQFEYGDLAFFSGSLPLREETYLIHWNGENFAVKKGKYSPPQYRFQAVQDADQFVLEKDYNKALERYQQVTLSNGLGWWSKDRRDYERKTTLNTWFHDMQKWFVATATPFPTLPAVQPDLAEYPRLAAYATYRMMILHTRLGEMDMAKTQYTTLQEKFPADNPGHPYAEMATRFWEAYQLTGKMYNACAAAIAYADAHPEILIPLGSDYHGWQSHTYTPADVCPFR